MAAAGPQATETLVAVNLLNVAVGAVGKTVRFGADSALGKASPYADMVKLAAAMAAGEIHPRSAWMIQSAGRRQACRVGYWGKRASSRSLTGPTNTG